MKILSRVLDIDIYENDYLNDAICGGLLQFLEMLSVPGRALSLSSLRSFTSVNVRGCTARSPARVLHTENDFEDGN